MLSVKSIVLFVTLVATCTAQITNYLNPDVFRTIGEQQLQAPPLHHHFNLSFNLNTYENTIHEVLPKNSSYQVRSPSAATNGVITLTIPLHHVSMRGMYFTTLSLTHGDQTTVLQNNTGSFRLMMSELDFRFRINFFFSLNGIVLETNDCLTNIGDVDFTLTELDGRPKPIELTAIKHLMEMEVKGQYGSMFCSTLSAITSRAVPSPLYDAIGNRIVGALEMNYQKSG
uniref:Uncharacterized LOC100179772 n=2 Tax=Ciona intestinalis TaxID=7719 RepID=F6RN92_CIOIN|nr:uncharacterized protein LOC100179772 isoform X1 [Ciona intestinalis]|eukprot:XP_026692135.1 uncharacterized protein LOC100179772 isoform X1 [Ciona intestinalis]